ncbi:MAG: hypothetical protein J7497_05020 [Chitinophagaceae bacterium]|nr:hypothetical protein [Chitinophagaceae bacterium]
MKKLIILSMVTFVALVSANAQQNEDVAKKEMKKEKAELRKEKKDLKKLEGNDVSYQAKQSFAEDFGNIPVSKWERTANFDEATFARNGETTKAFYDSDGELVGTTTVKTFHDIPVRAQQLINKKYPDYTKEAVILFDDNEFNETDMILYNQQFEDADNYFIELKKGDTTIIVMSDMNGDISYFQQM